VPSRPNRILVVDDEPQVVRAMERMLRRDGLEVETAPCAERALALLEARLPDVIISDYRMPGMNGDELLRLVAERHPAVGRILVSGYTVQVAACGGASIAHEIFAKPWDEPALLAAVHRLGSPR
jgi:DNA-binding NtrC family response regulator